MLDTRFLLDGSFRSLIHSELIFVYHVGLEFNFILWGVDSQLSQHPFLRKRFFPPLNRYGTLVKIHCP